MTNINQYSNIIVVFVKKIWDETSMFKEHKLFIGLRKN